MRLDSGFKVMLKGWSKEMLEDFDDCFQGSEPTIIVIKLKRLKKKKPEIAYMVDWVLALNLTGVDCLILHIDYFLNDGVLSGRYQRLANIRESQIAEAEALITKDKGNK